MSTGHENAGYRRLFDADGLTFGAGFPLTGSNRSRPDVDAEVRLANHAADVALGTASVVLTLRHPIHVATSAATVDQLSDGRLVLGVASGDRDPEFPAFGVDREDRGQLFRERFDAIRSIWREEYPDLEGEWGRLEGDLSVVPEPTTETLPLLPTGNSRQSREWIADRGDGWLFYHLPERTLEDYLTDWRERAGEKPFAIAIRVELADDPTADPEPLHLGFRAGTEWFRDYFGRLEDYGLDHAIVGVQNDDVEAALSTFADAVVDRL